VSDINNKTSIGTDTSSYLKMLTETLGQQVKRWPGFAYDAGKITE